MGQPDDTVRVHVTAATDPEVCSLPVGAHSYCIPLPEPLMRVLECAPVGAYIFDGTCLVLTAQSIESVEA